MPDYEAVVIGAGNGGLTAATTLAKSGVKTLLLEQHNVPGGCATSFVRGRFEFEVALHQLSGLGNENNPGPLHATFAKLGILDKLELVEEHDISGLVDRLDTLLQHPERWPEMGNQGHTRIQQAFDIASCNEHLLELFASLVARDK